MVMLYNKTQMQKAEPLVVLYRFDDTADTYPNMFITCPQQIPPQVKHIKEVFPWGQVSNQSLILEKHKWAIRFGVTMKPSIDCQFWLDLDDADTVPLVGENMVFLRLRKF